MEINKIYKGDALEVLRTFPEKSIDCVVTSPPYWALRDYGDTVRSIFGGNPDCNHTWGDSLGGIKHPVDTLCGACREVDIDCGQTCTKCGAWRGQLGAEPDFNDYVKHLCDIFSEAWRVLKDEGSLWVNIGDTYYTKSGSYFVYDNIGKKNADEVTKTTGLNKVNNLRGRGILPEKSLCNIPARFSIEMQNRGWILRNEVIWHKPNCMPSSVDDRFTVDFEKIFFFVKQRKYYFKQLLEPMAQSTIMRAKYGTKSKKTDQGQYAGMDIERQEDIFAKIRSGEIDGHNMRCVWTMSLRPFKDNHFASYPQHLVVRPLEATCPEGGVVLDPFMGSGTTGVVARKLQCNYVGIELNSKYIEIANKRIYNEIGLFL